MPLNKTDFIEEHYIRDIGVYHLENIKSFKYINEIPNSLIHYQFNKEYPDDNKIWFTCILALEAVSKGNFGIGALLTNPEGSIVAYGHNEVFNPYFRSDRHAEMVVLTKFEDEYLGIYKLGEYTLFTSLEPCPMCLARLITSGIGTIKYGADDPTGGMVHMMKNLPKVWLELSEKQVFSSAMCSAWLSKMAEKIFILNVNELNNKLLLRNL